MSLPTRSIRLPEFIDTRRVSPFQYGVITLSGLVMFLDGFDTQSISYVAPHIAKEWGLSPALLGPVFSSALVGLMVGYLLLSPLSQRFGHRRMLVAATAAFAVCTLAVVWSTGVTELIVLRFLTGLGLGAAVPSAIALTSEFSPKRLRATFVLVIYCGFSIGFGLAGVAAGALIGSFGWRSVFWAGAVLPLLLLPVLVWLMPESPLFLIGRGADPARIYRVFRRIDRALPAGDSPGFEVDDQGGAGRATLGSLFTGNRLLGTVLLWIMFALNYAVTFATASWLPTILTDQHYATSTVVAATTLISVGGIVAALVIGPTMDRVGPYGTLAVVYLAGCVFVALTGLAIGAPVWLLLAASVLVGVCVAGGQKSVVALAAVFYPAAVRSTGAGWALGIGRIGAILGPLAVGVTLTAGWSIRTVFYAMAVPMLVAGLAVLVMARRYRDTDVPPDGERAGSDGGGTQHEYRGSH
jgi:AAHS family 4-hydroxybenzoate transporter-like MFS transporter